MNKLTHLQEFTGLLDDYQPSAESLHILSQTKLVLLVAPTSSGRNTLIRQILKTGDYYNIISDTTRLPRVNDGVLEQDGVEYWFRDETDMLRDIRAGKYLEAAVIHQQQVSGISIRELEKAKREEKIAITDAEIVGVANVISYKPDTIAVFVLPPSFEEWQRRIKHRGKMSPEEYKRRMTSAEVEYSAALACDYYKFVINDSIDNAVSSINQIAKLSSIDDEEQLRAKTLAEQLLIETRSLLKSL
jgi:guanylate kinase